MLTNGIDLKIVEWAAHRPWPEKISINGEIYSNSRMSEEHGYSWRSTAAGSVIYFKGGPENRIEAFPLAKLKKAREHDKV